MIMGKNYFNEDQVKEALEKLGMRRPFSSHSLQHYKNLMNLAVETAIGEPLAYGVKLKSGMYGRLYSKKNEAIDDFTNWRSTYQEFEVLPFHKIQELEN